MIGMGSAGGAQPDDPVFAVFRVLGDPAAYQAKYDELAKQEKAAQQATADAVKAKVDADAAIAQVSLGYEDLAKARVEFESNVAVQKAALLARENDVGRRESDCMVREATITAGEAALAKATVQAKADLDTERGAFEADMVARSGALDRRKAALDDDVTRIQKQLDARATALSDRESATEQLNRAATALKFEYEQRISKLQAIASGKTE